MCIGQSSLLLYSTNTVNNINYLYTALHTRVCEKMYYTVHGIISVHVRIYIVQETCNLRVTFRAAVVYSTCYICILLPGNQIVADMETVLNPILY